MKRLGIIVVVAFILLLVPWKVMAKRDLFVLIKFKDNQAREEFLASHKDAERSRISLLVRLRKASWFRANWIKLSARFNSKIEYVEVGEPLRLAATPNDSYHSRQLYLDKIRAYEAWSLSRGSSSHVIAVIDTGVDLNHPDLDGKIWQNSAEASGSPGVDDDGNGLVDDIYGWDWGDNDNDPDDFKGHGTAVAGLAAAESNNAQGTTGIDWYAKIMVLKIWPNGSTGAAPDDAALAIRYAADKGAKVINMSWGSFTNYTVVSDAIQYAYNKGCVLVAATGNDGASQVYYPAKYSQVIGVGAVDANGALSSFTNRGTGLDMAAPGEDMFTTLMGGSWGNAGDGTSFAAPLVAGAASVLLAKQPNLSASQVKSKLISLGNDVTNYDSQWLNFYKVLKIYLIKTSSSSYSYIIDNGKRYTLWPSSTFWQRFGFSTSMVETVSSSTLNSYPSGGWFTGLWRLSNSSQWYYVDRGRRFPVWPSDTFKTRWGFRNEDITVVSPSLMTVFPKDRYLTGLVRGESNSQVYYVDRGGRKYPVWPTDIFWGRWGFNRDYDITIISDAQLNWMPTERWLTGLVRGDSDPQLYWIDYYGKKFKIPFGAYFWNQWRFSLEDVTVISQAQLDWMPYGGELSLYIKGELSPLVCRMTDGRCPIVTPPEDVAITTISQGQFNYMPR